jgi:hypothetical protein
MATENKTIARLQKARPSGQRALLLQLQLDALRRKASWMQKDIAELKADGKDTSAQEAILTQTTAQITKLQAALA